MVKYHPDQCTSCLHFYCATGRQVKSFCDGHDGTMQEVDFAEVSFEECEHHFRRGGGGNYP